MITKFKFVFNKKLGSNIKVSEVFYPIVIHCKYNTLFPMFSIMNKFILDLSWTQNYQNILN